MVVLEELEVVEEWEWDLLMAEWAVLAESVVQVLEWAETLVEWEAWEVQEGLKWEELVWEEVD